MWSRSTSRLRTLEIAPTLTGTSQRMTISKQTIKKECTCIKKKPHQTYAGTEDKRKGGTQDKSIRLHV